jgi:hypothetical protein
VTRARLALVLYLAIYYVLVAGAVATLWRSGLIDDLHVGWTLAAVGLALSLGGLLAITSRT